MRAAPPVRVDLRADARVQALVALLALLCVGGLTLNLSLHVPAAWPGLLASPLAALWAWHAAAVRPRRLRWDGQVWWLVDEPAEAHVEQAVSLEVVMDLDHWLLLRARPALGGPALYLPLARSHHLELWGALRATLFAARGGAVAR
ncbi:MAG: hypothetical protein E6Q67_03495 [Roseateles sp.]|nr:MAG: hypothetical protein E6Q67_03495 [Roseateles sp.]